MDQRAEAATTSPERSHIWQDARDVPALLALVGELTAQRDLARDAAVALEQENARLLDPNPHVPFKNPESLAAVLGLGLQPETSEQ